jgi:hypothetical protein
MKNKKKAKKRFNSWKKKGKDSTIQSRHIVGPKDYRKKKYMRDPANDTSTATFYPDRRK